MLAKRRLPPDSDESDEMIRGASRCCYLLTKFDSNTESTAGITTIAGESYVSFCYLCHRTDPIIFYEHSPEALVTHTEDLGQMIECSHCCDAAGRSGRG